MLWRSLFSNSANAGQCPSVISFSWSRCHKCCWVAHWSDKTKQIESSGKEFPRLSGVYVSLGGKYIHMCIKIIVVWVKNSFCWVLWNCDELHLYFEVLFFWLIKQVQKAKKIVGEMWRHHENRNNDCKCFTT